jgi:hypothetical protein
MTPASRCRPVPVLAVLAALAGWAAGPAAAQEPPVLRLELNAVETVDGACRLTFLVENTLGADLAALGFETVILTPDARVAQMTLFDFRDIPEARPRVRQFDLAGLPCDGIGRILINGASACDGAAPDACIGALKLESRVEQELVG